MRWQSGEIRQQATPKDLTRSITKTNGEGGKAIHTRDIDETMRNGPNMEAERESTVVVGVPIKVGTKVRESNVLRNASLSFGR